MIIPEAPPGVHVGVGLSIVEAVAALNLPHERNESWGRVTVAVGAVCVSPASSMVKDVFRQADELLYKAKGSGRNRCESN